MGAVTDPDVPDPPSAKVVAALLRDARSLSRRADKLDDAAAVADSTTRQLAAEARTSIDSLVHHLWSSNVGSNTARTQRPAVAVSGHRDQAGRNSASQRPGRSSAWGAGRGSGAPGGWKR